MAVHILYGLLTLLRWSYRFKVINPEVLAGIKESSEEGNYVFAMWHCNILSYMAFFHGVSHVNLASQSKDGSIISKLLEKNGHSTVRGSSSKGGRRAMMTFAQLLKRGASGTITVDGPRGPATVPKEGIFLIAKMSGVKIVPLSFKPHSFRRFEKSWDRFCFPLPFSTIEVCYGGPIEVGPDYPRKEFGTLARRLKRELSYFF